MSQSSETTTTPAGKPLPAWLVPGLFVAGLVTAVASEPVIAANRERFFTATGLPPFPPALMWKVFWDNVYNHSICYGFMGLMLFGLIGALVGLTISPVRAVMGLVVGAIVGVIGGALLGTMGWLITDKVLGTSNMDSIFKAIIIFIPFWFGMAIVGCLVALFAGNRLRLVAKTIKPAIVYAAIATALYVAIVTVLFPSDWPGRIIPEYARIRIVMEITGCLGVVTAVLMLLRANRNSAV
jgi:hypothetical protein